MHDRRSLLVLSSLSTLLCGLAAQRPAIMLTGYWPPSNEAIRQFSPSPTQNPGGWQGADWEGRGYDVYAYFPEFSPPTCTSCGTGTGDLTVDYQDTSADFWPLANALRPIAVITFSRSSTQITWELEMNQFNRTAWVNDYVAPLQPTPVPPDTSVPPDALRLSTLPVQQIVNDIVTAGLAVNPNICFSGNGGGFLSEFIAYHGVWYQDLHRSPTDPAWCVAAGHVHVGRNLSWPLARAAAEVTLRTVMGHVDAVRAGTVCQQDIGFQGPGSATLQVCGQPLNDAQNRADLRIEGTTPSTIGLLAFGLQSNPTPAFGGVAVPLPFFWADVVQFDAQGGLLREDFVPGISGGTGDAFAQAIYFDPLLPQQWGFTNALLLTLH